MMVIRSSQVPADGTPATERDVDPLQEQAAELFAEQLAADRVPSVRAIRAELHVGQARAQRLRDYLVAGTEGRWKVPLREQLHVHSDCGTTLPQLLEGMTTVSPHSAVVA